MSGWLCPLDDVPDAVFAGRMMGDGVAIDPTGDLLCSPADATVLNVHEAGHAVTLRLGCGAEILLHFGLDTVRLGSQGFTPLVIAGAKVRTGDPLLRVEINALASRVNSLMTPLIITDAACHDVVQHSHGRLVALGEPVLTLVARESVRPSDTGAGAAAFTPDSTVTIRIPLAHGLHARPSARLAQLVRGFDADVRLITKRATARLRSPSTVLALGLRHGDMVTIGAAGSQARDALDAVVAMIASGMGEAAPLFEASHGNSAPIVAPAAPRPGDQLSGVCASPGLAVGQAWSFALPEPEIAAANGDPAVELARFYAARAQLAERLGGKDGDVANAILGTHLALLEDEDILADTRAAIAAGASAGHGWRKVMQTQAARLRASPDPRFSERANDLLDLELQLQWRLVGQEMPTLDPPDGAILIADDLMPSQVATLDPQRLGGIATARGGPTSHVAIIAASKGIPALVALGPAVLAIVPDTEVILDAGAGVLQVAPDAELLGQTRQRIAHHAARKEAALASAMLEGRTADGARIEVFANLGKSDEAAPAVAAGAEGCGLLRTEFLFLDRASAPDEMEQADTYAAVADGLGGRPLIVRLLDIGGDKPAPYLPIGPEENPALGLRGIRVALANPAILDTQLRAIIRAGVGRDLRVMAPMIARVEELRAVREVLNGHSAAFGLDAPSLGVMVETPAAAIMADRLAAECDFLSIGTNDLSQYVLAMDRGNPMVAARLDGLDPAVLRMIDLCCRGAERHGKWVGVCGGLASDPLAVPILIGLGVTELSAAPAMLAEIKATVRAFTLARCRELAAAVLAVPTAQDVRALAGQAAKETGL